MYVALYLIICTMVVKQKKDANSICDVILSVSGLKPPQTTQRGGKTMNISDRFYKLLDFLRNSNLLGMQVFNCESLVNDAMECVYSEDGIRVLVCYYWNYVEVLGISDEEFKAISTMEDSYTFLKKHL